MYKILILVLLLAVTAFAQIDSVNTDTVSLLDARTSLRALLNDNDSTAGKCRWSNTMLNQYINLAVRETATGGAILKLDTIVTSVDKAFYWLKGDCIVPVFALIKGSENRWKSLAPKDYGGFARTAATGAITSYCVMDKLVLFDRDGSTNGDSVIITYSAYANNLTADSSTINIPYALQDSVLSMAYRKAREAR